MATRINTWNPIREITAMQNVMDRLLEDTVRGMNGNGQATVAGNWLALDIYENDEAYTVVADLPNINPDDIDITLHENKLTIATEVMQPEIPEGTTRLVNERVYGKFRRNITLPNDVNADAVDADYTNGVLTLTMPKSEASKPRQINVKTGQLLASEN